jgi:anti-sigma regulatory factor (Ser/Thr protein kinase)
MQEHWLTVKLVESVHHALMSGRSVAATVANLRGATLPGLLEYKCLQWALNSSTLPPLPPTILSSPLGMALGQVRSDLGLRTSGPQKGPQANIDARPVEFCVIQHQDELEQRTWQQFETRFPRSAQGVGFPALAAHELQAALHEMVDNALDHAEAPIPVLVGYRVLPGIALFTVVDVGRGVLASLRSNSAYQRLQRDKDAIREALHDGVSRYGANRGGLGFRQVFKALLAQWGYLRFRSGNGSITMDGNDFDADKGEARYPPSLPGFQVTVCCRTSGVPPPEPLV